MKLGLINSAWLGSPVGTAQGIYKTKEIGFDSIDISADPLEIDIKERKLIKDTCRQVGLPVISVCCCALGIADFNGAVSSSRNCSVAASRSALIPSIFSLIL